MAVPATPVEPNNLSFWLLVQLICCVSPWYFRYSISSICKVSRASPTACRSHWHRILTNWKGPNEKNASDASRIMFLEASAFGRFRKVVPPKEGVYYYLSKHFAATDNTCEIKCIDWHFYCVLSRCSEKLSICVLEVRSNFQGNPPIFPLLKCPYNSLVYDKTMLPSA